MDIKSKENLEFGFRQSGCLIVFAMLYVSIMICNAVLTNRWIGLWDGFVFGGAFVSPFIFIIGDIIAEIFGYKIAKSIIMMGFICQTLVAVIITLVLAAPMPESWQHNHSFSVVLGSILRVDLSGVVAYISSGIINVYLVTKWKILLQGKMFWLRSLGASTIAEALYSGIAIMMIALGTLPFNVMMKVILYTYLIKAGFSVLFAYPGCLLVYFVKNKFKIDVYDNRLSFKMAC